MQSLIISLLAIFAVIIGGYIAIYNRLTKLRQMVRNGWSDVDVYLKRRADLIPNLVEAVRGYAHHEEDTFTRTIEARNQALSASSVSGRAAAEGVVSTGLGRAMILAEGYPDLKASHSFLDLQKQLGETEKLIASARQYYNACVRDFNTMVESFPSSLIAGTRGFKQAEFFEVESSSERASPRISGLG
jgi:LemA protein